MNRFFTLSYLAAAMLALNNLAAPAPAPAEAAPSEEKSLLKLAKWAKGPVKVDLGSEASLHVKSGYMFAGAEDTQKLLEAMGNPTSGTELGFLAPTNASWFVIFEFSDVGYVKDDDKDKLDAGKLLTTIRKGTEESNKMRKKMGAPEMKIVGWEHPPKYNETTHNLEWAIRGESEGEPVINYNTRILGRSGVMEANLVIDPEELAATLPIYQEILKDYSFKTGKTYAEYKQGDRIAQYGLAALITGGAAAVAVKTGLMASIILFFKKGAKLIIVAIVAIGAFIKKLALGGGRRDVSS